MARGYFRTSDKQCTMCGKSEVVASEGKGANKFYMCSECLRKTIASEIRNEETMKFLHIKKLDVTDIGKSDIIEMLYNMEKLEFSFDDDFQIFAFGNERTRLYMNESLQGGWYRKYMSRKELENKM